jgi:hypothetical protein
MRVLFSLVGVKRKSVDPRSIPENKPIHWMSMMTALVAKNMTFMDRV